MSTHIDLYADKGSTFSVVVNVKNKDGSPFDCSGYSARSQVRKNYKSDYGVSLTCNFLDQSEGEISLSLDSTETRNMKAGRYYYDVELFTSVDGVVTRILEGQFEVNERVTSESNNPSLGDNPVTISHIDRVDNPHSVKLSQLGDIDFLSNPVSDGQALTYNETLDKWVSSDISETNTQLTFSGNSLTYVDELGSSNVIDLSLFLDEDYRSIASGVLNPTTGVVTFTRDDSTTFTLDLSSLLDDTNLVTSVAGKSGVVTLVKEDITDFSDGDYEPADSSILKNADIGASVQGYTDVLNNTTASFTTADEDKLDNISVTQPIDLDNIIASVGDVKKDGTQNYANIGVWKNDNGDLTGSTELSWNGVSLYVQGNVTAQGSITTTGLVDGRDLAVDGAKLDAITGTNTGDETQATVTTLGLVELATQLDIDDGSASTAGMAISPFYLKNSGYYTDRIANNAKITADETNVLAALDGASITDAGTPATDDKVLIQDTSDSDKVKYVNISDISSGGQVDSVVAGTNVTVDNTDPVNPVVNATNQTLDSVTTNGSTTSNDISVGGRITTSNNTAVGGNATAIGGTGNSASGASSEVLGGDGSTASGQGSTVVGGSNHQNSGNWSASVGGLNQTITAVRGLVSGGFGNTLQHNDSTMLACQNKTSVAINTTHVENLHSFGGITMPTGANDGYVLTADANGVGTWQAAAGGPAGPSGTTLSGTTSNNTQAEIFVDGVASSRMTIATDTTWMFSAMVAARSTTESAGYKIEGVIKNDGGTTSLVGIAVKTVFAEEDSSWDITVEADDTNDALIFKVTGDSTDSVTWEVTVDKTEAS